MARIPISIFNEMELKILLYICQDKKEEKRNVCFERQVAAKGAIGTPSTLKKQHRVVPGSVDPGARLQVFESQLCHIPATAKYSVSLQILVLIWKMGLIISMKIFYVHICKMLKRILGI